MAPLSKVQVWARLYLLSVKAALFRAHLMSAVWIDILVRFGAMR